VELITNETFYSNMYSHVIGLFDTAIKAMCKNNTFSELYEICALCNVLGCKIRSVYPHIDFRSDMGIMNNIFTPAPPTIASDEITILWSNVWNEMNVRAVNNNMWSPNHFVPLMSPGTQHESDHSNQYMLTVKVSY
jgi:hypothetical protein